DRDLSAVGETGLLCRRGLTVDDTDVETGLVQEPGRGDAGEACAENEYMHDRTGEIRVMRRPLRERIGAAQRVSMIRVQTAFCAVARAFELAEEEGDRIIGVLDNNVQAPAWCRWS